MPTLSTLAALLALLLVPFYAAEAESDPRRGEQDLRYLGILFGPSLQEWSSTQGDPELPVAVRNFLSWNLRLNDGWRFGVTGSWSWRPVQGQDLTLRDPFIKLAKTNLIQSGDLNWYTDARFHLPLTERSRNRDLWWGIQSFNSLEWSQNWGGLGLYASGRHNQFGSLGAGDEWEFYVAPHVELQIADSLTLTSLLEWGGGMPFGGDSGLIFSDGFTLQPGLSWDITQGLNWSPYLFIPLNGVDDPLQQSSLNPVTLGMTLSWKIDSWK